MIYVATKNQQANTKVYFSKNKKSLQELGFKWIRNFKSESNAVMWSNESYLRNEKVFLY